MQIPTMGMEKTQSRFWPRHIRSTMLRHESLLFSQHKAYFRSKVFFFAAQGLFSEQSLLFRSTRPIFGAKEFSERKNYRRNHEGLLSEQRPIFGARDLFSEHRNVRNPRPIFRARDPCSEHRTISFGRRSQFLEPTRRMSHKM